MKRFGSCPQFLWLPLLCVFAGEPALAQRLETGSDPAVGIVEIDISDLLGRQLASWVEFVDRSGNRVLKVTLPDGIGSTNLPSGSYTAFVSVEHLSAPFLVAVRSIVVAPNQTEYLLVSLGEGSASRPLHEFDSDHDLAIDRVEIEAGSDPNDPSSIPGHQRLTWSSPVIKDQPGWYVGDLHAFSEYSTGSESVSKLVKRAESTSLDFIAITDRNTLDHTRDKGFSSKRTVLIPAMQWGDDEHGYALILKPGTVPKTADDEFEAQAVLDRAVEQGGVFAPAHPCFPTSPWLRKIGYFNAVEVWCRDWRGVPPLDASRLTPELLTREADTFVFPIARAAHTPYYSANGQADYFWRLNLNAVRKSAALGGSHSAVSKVPLGTPLTHVYAEKLSLDEIIRGIRLGRTKVSRDANSPKLEFSADVFNDGRIETRIGGIIPLHEETRFVIYVEGAMGKRLEVLQNGEPIRTIDIPQDKFDYGFLDSPERYSNYIVRVTETPTGKGYGLADMLIMTSPIYAQEIVFVDEVSGRSSWVSIESEVPVPEGFTPPPIQP